MEKILASLLIKNGKQILVKGVVEGSGPALVGLEAAINNTGLRAHITEVSRDDPLSDMVHRLVDF